MHSNIISIKASILSSIIEVFYTHPIDVIKTHQQNSKKFKFNSSLFKGINIRAFGIIPIRTFFWTGQTIANNNGINKSFQKALFVSLIQTSIDTPIENFKIKKIYNLKKINLYNGFIPHYLRNSIFIYSFLKSNDFIENKLIAGAVGGFTGSFLSHPLDTYKTMIQSNQRYIIKNYTAWFNGLSARCLICTLSMTIGNWSYNYLLNIL